MSSELFIEKFHVARKQYTCYECHCEILPGTRYQVSSGKWDGHFLRYRTCEGCAELWAEVKAAWQFWDDPPCFGQLMDIVLEMDMDDRKTRSS